MWPKGPCCSILTESVPKMDYWFYSLSQACQKHEGTTNVVLGDPKEDCLYLVCLVEVFFGVLSGQNDVGVLCGQKVIVVHF